LGEGIAYLEIQRNSICYTADVLFYVAGFKAVKVILRREKCFSFRDETSFSIKLTK